VQIPERVRAEAEIPATKHFDLQAVFDEEQTRLNRWLEAQASEVVRSPNPTTARASEDGEIFVQQIHDRFAPSNDNYNRELLIYASDGSLLRHAPNRSAVFAYQLLKWIALLAEMALGLGVWLVADGTPVLILVAGMLAGAGWLAGKGVGSLFERRLAATLPRELGHPQAPSLWSGAAMATIGYGVVLGLSYLRAMGDDREGMIYVIGFTVLLALLISIFEALHSFISYKYEFLRRQMGLAQRWYANQHHAKALQTYRKHFDGRVSHLLAEEKRIFERPVKEVA
jgi:hypothetical protein